MRRTNRPIFLKILALVVALGLTGAAAPGSASAQPSTCELIVGRWAWAWEIFGIGGVTVVTIRSNGTTEAKNGNTGTWECTDPARRIFTLKWKDIWASVDTLTLSKDGTLLAGRTSVGAAVSGNRIGPVPGAALAIVAEKPDERLRQQIARLEAERRREETAREQAELERMREAEERKKMEERLTSLEQQVRQGMVQPSAPKPIADRWAVVVGISKYQDPKIPSLLYADADARAFAQFLQTEKGGSFKHVRLLLNEQATLVNLRDALGGFLKEAHKDDLVIIYFAAHGMPEPGRTDTTYFMPHDAELKRLYSTAVPMDEIDKILNQRIYAEKVVMIADACHSGFVGTRTRAVAVQAAATTNRFFSELAKAKPGRAIFTAISASELSQEDEKWGGGHGVFTYYLLEGLNGKADADKNGVVTIREAFDYTYDKVPRATNNDQHPELKGTFDNNIPLAVVR